jgi:WD repeat-containing protein 35
LVLCNAVGCPIDSKTVTIEPKHAEMNKTHVIIASDDIVYFWQYRSAHAKLVSLESRSAKSGKENVFHIDESPKADMIYDRERWIKPQIECTDMITSIAAGPDSFIVGR